MQATLRMFTICLAITVLSALGIATAMRPQKPQPHTAPSEFEFVITAANQRQLEVYVYQRGSLRKTAQYQLPDDLPHRDLSILKTGIALRNATELQRSLEDYLQ